MAKLREKRTFDSWLYDIDCSSMLAIGEQIISVVSVSCDQAVGFIFGPPVINTKEERYPDGSRAGIGQIIQVQIGGGVIPDGSDDMGLGIPNILCTLRAKFVTNFTPDQGDATLLLLLKDKILPP